MDRRLLSLLLLAVFTIVAVRLSTASADDLKRVKTPPLSGGGDVPRSQSDTDVPEAAPATLDSHVNGTEGSSDATFVRVAETTDQEANTDRESEGEPKTD